MRLPALLLALLCAFSLSGCALHAPQTSGPRPAATRSAVAQGTTRQIGDQFLHYDAQGRPAGTTRQIGDRLLHYDRAGRPAGTTRQIGDTLLHYDKEGRPAGTSRAIGDTLLHYDRAGRPSGQTRESRAQHYTTRPRDP